MSISFEEAIGQLKIMFPDWEEETLSTLLVANNYHVERTIETVLSMNGDITPNEKESTTLPVPAAITNTNQNLLDVYDEASSSNQHSNSKNEEVGKPIASSVPKKPQEIPSSSSSSSRYRGIKCDLPDDFLRPPSWQSPNVNVIADEELAMMLQNEMFQKEVRARFGDDFILSYQNQPNNNTTTNSGNRVISRQDTRRGSNTTAANTTGNNANADMGIMKALSSMGTATKRSLSALAAGFSSNKNGNNSAGGNAGAPASNPHSRHSTERRSLNGREFKPLVDGEDDDTEVISFDSHGTRSSHVLQDTAPKRQDDDDSENPLLRTMNNPMNYGSRSAQV